ncbi:hypothetical protein OG285_32360 [Streptomyces sp. NBC_01471]|uniref:hypothetical protein n=1 Tax=Streptomyces sp. NBC_01471 TaxID=2903879 RepID=UPI00324C662B
MSAENWPFGTDADQHDPLTKLRIPVTSTHPKWRYIAAFDRDSGARPTDAEAAMLASYIQEYKARCFNDWYKVKLLKRPLDVDAVTRIFHKWDDDDWSYRVGTWQYGPFWLPAAPRLRGSQRDDASLPAMTLVQVMDCSHTVADEPMQHWLNWKANHPEVFPA